MIKCKWTQNPDKKSIIPMQQLHMELNNCDRSYVVCRTPSTYKIEQAEVVNGVKSIEWLN